MKSLKLGGKSFMDEFIKLDPLNELGTPIEIIKAFGGLKQYEKVIKELEEQLYNLTA